MRRILPLLVLLFLAAAVHAASAPTPVPPSGSASLPRGGYLFAYPPVTSPTFLVFRFNSTHPLHYGTGEGSKLRLSLSSSYASGGLELCAGCYFVLKAQEPSVVSYSFFFAPLSNLSSSLEERGFGRTSLSFSVRSPPETALSPFSLNVTFGSSAPVRFVLYDATAARTLFSSEMENTPPNLSYFFPSLQPGVYYLIFEGNATVFYDAFYSYAEANPASGTPGISAYPPSPGFPTGGVGALVRASYIHANGTQPCGYYKCTTDNATLLLLTSVVAETSDGGLQFFYAGVFDVVGKALGDFIVNATGVAQVFSSGVVGKGSVLERMSYAYPPPPREEIYFFEEKRNTTFPLFLSIWLSVGKGTGFALHFSASGSVDNATVILPSLSSAALGGWTGESYSPFPPFGRGALLGTELSVSVGSPVLYLSGYSTGPILNISAAGVLNASLSLSLFYSSSGGWKPFPVVYGYAADAPAGAAVVGENGSVNIFPSLEISLVGRVAQSVPLISYPTPPALFNKTPFTPPEKQWVFILSGGEGGAGRVRLLPLFIFVAVLAAAVTALVLLRRRVKEEVVVIEQPVVQQVKVVEQPVVQQKEEEKSVEEETDRKTKKFFETLSMIYKKVEPVEEEVEKKYYSEAEE